MTKFSKRGRNLIPTVLLFVFGLSLCFGLGYALKPKAMETSFKSMSELWKNEKFSSISTGEIIPSYANPNLVPEKAIKVVASGNNATVSFANVVNLKGLTKNDPFINIFIAPQTLGGPGTKRYTQDFGKIKVRLTDADDEGNYVDILVQRSVWGSGIYYQVATQDVSLAGRGTFGGEEQMLSDSRGTQIGGFGPFYGQGANDLNENVAPITIRYDYEEKAVYPVHADGVTLNRMPSRDLDSMEDMGAGFEWKGFTSGRVKISISAIDFYNSTGTYYITNFLGLDVSQTMVSDVTPPNLQTVADTEPALLTGVVGRNYPLFDAVADDMIFGSVVIKKEIITPNSNVSELIEGDYYLPTIDGEHQLIYSATDGFGNVSEKNYTFKVLPIHPEITLDLEKDLLSTAYVGEKISIPKATASGGVYKVDIQVDVQNEKDGTAKKIENGVFTPDSAGVYLVRYRATDFLGGTAILSQRITVERGQQPIGVFPTLPKVFISGKTIKLPEMSSWDYINNPAHKQNAIVEVYESKTSVVEGDYGTKITDLSAYTPQLLGSESSETVYITYVSYCSGYESQKLVKTYPIELVRLKQMYDLFAMDGITPTLTDSYITFSTETDGASMTYGLPISARQSEIIFEIEKERNNFNSLRLTFTDSENSNQQVQIDVTKTLGSAKSFVYVHGIRYMMSGSFDETAPGVNKPLESFKIKIAEDMGSIADVNNTKICNFSTYLDGSTFKGFESGKIYVEFSFLGVSGDSAINLKNFGVNQPVRGLKSNGEFVDFVDTGKPYIYISDTLSQVVDIYQRVYVPAAYAYDVIDMNVNCSVEVIQATNTGTKVIVSSTVAENGVSFIPDDYGIYTIRFTAKDVKGNTSQRTLYVYVEDKTAPTLVIDGTYEKSYTQNAKVSIATASAKDLQGEAIVNVFVIDPMGKGKNVQMGDEVTFEKKGLYIIRYCAFDVNYNYTISDFRIEVK